MKKIGKWILKHRRLEIALLMLVGFVIALFLLMDQSEIEVSFYQVQSDKVSENVRIAVIADLHLKEFGEDNRELVDQITRLSPDIIACVGDSNKVEESNYDVVLTLFKQLTDVAPVYYSLGNHEYEAMLFHDSQIARDLKELGVHVLNDASEIVTVGNTKLNIGGLSQSQKQFEKYGHKFFDKYIQEDYFKLLLVHYPEEFLGVLEEYPIDLALCGHDHGGQIRVPYFGGLYAPDQGILPEMTEGYFEIENSRVIVSRGLGNSSWIPRINNDPELVVVDLSWY